jgi:hypothetical protein
LRINGQLAAGIDSLTDFQATNRLTNDPLAGHKMNFQ